MLGVLQDSDRGCCWYNANTGFAFGPVFRDLTEALEFEKWLESYDLGNPLQLDQYTIWVCWEKFNRRIPSGI